LLIDTGGSNARGLLEGELERAGCRPGGLKLIVLTHGDFDHIGNAAYLRTRFGTRIAMHKDDAGMAERGDMLCNRKSGNALIRTLVPLFFGFGKDKRFAPDVLLEEGSDLAEYGLEARVVSLPGHSKGSTGVLTAGGDLFCGDLFENTKGPALGSIVDDRDAAMASASRLKGAGVKAVYPGHGKPFAMQQLGMVS
jgi:glyoxylase-like metal-dependent hydrolase (beta-lactamase superfamily II)